MTHVVTENCDQCRFTECVTVCPVACFHGDQTHLYIDPDVCIDCGACVSVCPVKAILDSIDLEPAREEWIAVNRERAKSLPVVRDKGEPLLTAAAKRESLGL
jgi:ferredoxin